MVWARHVVPTHLETVLAKTTMQALLQPRCAAHVEVAVQATLVQRCALTQTMEQLI